MIDAAEIWKRVGLERLREALSNVQKFSVAFEESLKSLPKCDECARSVLLEQIKIAGQDLGSEVISLVSLSETLREAVKEVEKSQTEMIEKCPPSCCCSQGECICHSARANT